MKTKIQTCPCELLTKTNLLNTRKFILARWGQGLASFAAFLGPESLTSRQAGMNRCLGEGSPWGPACFQPESSAPARDLSQGVGPAGERETRSEARRGSEAGKGAGLAERQSRASGWVGGPHGAPEPHGRSRLRFRTTMRANASPVRCKAGGRFPGSDTRERLPERR